jgi:hypothetical protein
VRSGKSREYRLRNWYSAEVLRSGDNDDFTWGYHGEGPHATAYSILREFFGKKVAEDRYDEFVNLFVSKLDEGDGFVIDSATAARTLGLRAGRG